tara:strand:+ start:99 stop:278 length:180 start_codon:yes stop_codon:yes gene_type:complete
MNEIEEMKIRCDVAVRVFESIIKEDKGWKLSQIKNLSISISDDIVDNSINRTWPKEVTK